MEGNPISSMPSSPTKLKSFTSLLKENPKSTSYLSDPPPALLPPAVHHEEPALKIPQVLIEQLSSPFRFTLVGKFSHGRPTMERARSVFAKLDLKGNYFIGHLDPKHILIMLEHEGDFYRLWLKDLFFLDGF